jgi:Tyrosine phosphatase family
MFPRMLVSILFLVSFSAQTFNQTTSPQSYSLGTKRKLEGVPDFGEVTPFLYRGGQPTREGFEKLAKMGINIVVDTGRSRRDEKLIRELGMHYVSLPWYCPFPKDEVFARFIKLVKDNPDKKIFVHCRLGEDRTGMMIASYRMGAQGWTAEDAMREMHVFGYKGAHHLMCPGLAGYEKSFPERLKNNPLFRDLKAEQRPK